MMLERWLAVFWYWTADPFIVVTVQVAVPVKNILPMIKNILSLLDVPVSLARSAVPSTQPMNVWL